ncbi:MAG: hypothetical protein U0575_02250 [Phycisphaerales bacterium]
MRCGGTLPKFPACTPLRGRHSAAPTPTGSTDPIVNLTRSNVSTSVHCRQCGYDLKGLAATGRCPECGLAIVETLTQLVDPAASRLPRLRDPRGTGTGLVGLAATHLVAATLVIVPRAAGGIELVFGRAASPLRWLPLPPRALAAIVGLSALFWLYLIARAPAEEPTREARRHVRWMVRGQLWWSLTVALPVLAARLGVTERALVAPLEAFSVPGAVAAFMGLRGLLKIIGLRSRAYRTARGGRQSIDALVGAIVAGATGNLVNAFGIWKSVPWLEAVGATIFGASTLLLLLGLVYLLVNCWWIRSSLRKPPPTWDELLTPV